MNAELIGNIILAWGLQGCLGVAGCYLILGSIMGRLISFPPIVKREHRVRHKAERFLLGFFGLLLAFPIVFAAWRDIFRGIQTTVVPPKIEEKVKEPDPTSSLLFPELNIGEEHSAAHIGRMRQIKWNQNSEISPLIITSKFSPVNRFQNSNCEKIESFGLEQYKVRTLKYHKFRGEVYVYVGDIRTFGGTDLYLAIGKVSLSTGTGEISESEFLGRVGSSNKLKLNFKRKGASMEFDYLGMRYRLTVTNIYIAIFGTDKIAVDICEIK